MNIHPGHHHGSVLVVLLCLVALVVLVFFCISLYESSQIPSRPPPDEITVRRISEEIPALVVTNAVAVEAVRRWVLQVSMDLTNWQDRPDGIDLDWFTNRCGFWRFREQ